MQETLFMLVLASCIWVYFDAQQIARNRQLPGWLPARWSVACGLLWPVFFPLYLTRRGDEEGFKAEWTFLRYLRYEPFRWPRKATAPPQPGLDPRVCPSCGYPNAQGWTTCFKCGEQKA